ncbi:MAG: hypothetical protein ACRD19_04865 [Terriglobia bacterium]
MPNFPEAKLDWRNIKRFVFEFIPGANDTQFAGDLSKRLFGAWTIFASMMRLKLVTALTAIGLPA